AKEVRQQEQRARRRVTRGNGRLGRRREPTAPIDTGLGRVIATPWPGGRPGIAEHRGIGPHLQCRAPQGIIEASRGKPGLYGDFDPGLANAVGDIEPEAPGAGKPGYETGWIGNARERAATGE